MRIVHLNHPSVSSDSTCGTHDAAPKPRDGVAGMGKLSFRHNYPHSLSHTHTRACASWGDGGWQLLRTRRVDLYIILLLIIGHEHNYFQSFLAIILKLSIPFSLRVAPKPAAPTLLRPWLSSPSLPVFGPSSSAYTHTRTYVSARTVRLQEGKKGCTVATSFSQLRRR